MSKERLQHQYKKTLPRKQAAVIEEEMQPDLAPLVASLEQSSTPRDSLLVQADSPALRQVGMLRLQRSHGNTHVQRMVGESRTASPSPVVQRYQAGDTGHGGIEKYTLQGLGFAPDEAAQVYLGNWLRDLSQLTDKSW